MGKIIRDSIQENYDTMVQETCLIYQEIEKLYKSLDKGITTTSSVTIDQTTVRINDLLKATRLIDQRITKLQADSKTPITNTTLLNTKKILVANLIEANSSICKKAKNIASHFKHEMSAMSTNRNAINGYKPVSSVNKNIIRSFF